MRHFLTFSAAACLLTGPAFAQDYLDFQSPTGNIKCAIYSGGDEASARCDMSKLTPSYRKRPAGCEFDWGSSFAVDRIGKGYLACVSDPATNGNEPVLGYGQSVSLGGIACVSAKTGVTCTNADGHGFSIAKAKQKLF